MGGSAKEVIAMVEEVDQADELFAAFHARFAPFFFRAEVRHRSRRYLRALLGTVERKNGWQLAETMGEGDPNGAQRLLFEAIWDEDAVRDELERFVAEQFGDPEQGIFVLDESALAQEGNQVSRGQTAVLRGAGQEGELPSGGVPHLRLAAGARLPRSPALSAGGLGSG
jgi:hypothetical protein